MKKSSPEKVGTKGKLHIYTILTLLRYYAYILPWAYGEKYCGPVLLLATELKGTWTLLKEKNQASN